MQTHNLTKKKNNSQKKRIGRGGKRGSFSGRGIKGQKARAGRRIRPELRDFIKKLPKHKGHNQATLPKSRTTVSTLIIAKKFNPGDTISPKTLLKKRLVRRIRGKTPIVKILGSVKVLEKFTISNCEVSGKHE